MQDPYTTYLNQRRAAQQFRALKPTRVLPAGHAERDGKDLINFAGNDYLGLSQHPALIAAAVRQAQQDGTGGTASRLIVGNHPLYDGLEQQLAAGKGTEAALVMNGGYQTNLTVLAALADAQVISKPVILADRLIHHSLLQGAMLSGARLSRYHHNDYDHLRGLLEKHCAEKAHILIVTESVFGMDGDRADVTILTGLAAQFGAMLYVDEAHATGLFGQSGFGFCADHRGKIDIAMGTFGKALGSYGAYIGCSSTLRDYLVQRCGGLIYSTALPPAVLASIKAALDLLPSLQAQRDNLQADAARVRNALTAQGWDCGASTTHIIPILLGDEPAALTLAELLLRENILVAAVRPPTVPRGTSRLRLSLTAAHSDLDLDHLVAAMATQARHFARAA